MPFQVVVMTFCEGFKVTDAEALAAAKLDREGVMRKITESFAYQVSRFPVFFTAAEGLRTYVCRDCVSSRTSGA